MAMKQVEPEDSGRGGNAQRNDRRGTEARQYPCRPLQCLIPWEGEPGDLCLGERRTRLQMSNNQRRSRGDGLVDGLETIHFEGEVSLTQFRILSRESGGR
jgi:hypothetical protein